MKEELLQFCKSLGLDAVGITNWPLPHSARDYIYEKNPCPFTTTDIEERLHGNTQIDHPQSAIVCLFPYSTTEKPKEINLARYTWSCDYHLVVPHYLEKIITYLRSKHPEDIYQYEIHCDTSPLADRYLAYLAGLGFYGENHCFINPRYGSYVVIGTILTNLELPPDRPLQETCLGCKRCIHACPGQAIGSGTFLYDYCKSYLTQKKGDLENYEKAIIAKSPLIFGCDICQEVCPHNANLPLTPILEFRQIDPYLDPQELQNMSNKEFKIKFGHKAFSWRGKSILLRNANIVKKEMR